MIASHASNRVRRPSFGRGRASYVAQDGQGRDDDDDDDGHANMRTSAHYERMDLHKVVSHQFGAEKKHCSKN